MKMRVHGKISSRTRGHIDGMCLDYQVLFPKKEKIGDEELPPNSELLPEVMEGTASYIISKFSPLYELPLKELSYIYMLEPRQSRQLAFNILVARFLEKANPWVDFANEDTLDTNKFPLKSALRTHREQIETYFQTKFEDLENEVLSRLPPERKHDLQRYKQILKETIKEIRLMHQRELKPYEINKESYECCKMEKKLMEKVEREKRDRNNNMSNRQSTPNVQNEKRKVLPENFDVYKTLRIEELQNIFEQKTNEERWVLFRDTVRRKVDINQAPDIYYACATCRKLMKDFSFASKMENPEDIFNEETRAIFEGLNSEINAAMNRRDLKSSDYKQKQQKDLKKIIVQLKRMSKLRNEERRESKLRQEHRRMWLAERVAERAMLAKMEEISEKTPRARIRIFENTHMTLPDMAFKKSRHARPVLPMLDGATNNDKTTNLPAVSANSFERGTIDKKDIFLRRQKNQCNASTLPPIAKRNNRIHVFLHAKPFSL